MNSAVESQEKSLEAQVQENITNWQASDNPLAPLTNEQLDLIYEVGDKIQELFYSAEGATEVVKEEVSKETQPYIAINRSYIKWLIDVEEELKYESLRHFQLHQQELSNHHANCENLFECSNATLDSLNQLKEKYDNVTSKTNYLHNLSEQLMAHQRVLKQKKGSLSEKLKYFTSFSKLQDNVDRFSNKINSKDFTDILDSIGESIHFLNDHMQYKESRIYKMKYESLLTTALNKIYNYVNNIVIDTTKHIVDSEMKAVPLIQNSNEPGMDSAFSLYYGKFQSAATKVKYILMHLEDKEDNSEQYMNILSDCQKSYLNQRLPILSVAVAKALAELKEKHRVDHSILFRSCALFTMKVCQDEAHCYGYFFSKTSEQLNDYLANICQHLYDTLRPCLISINHIEVLSELCGILKKEMLSDKILSNENLEKYVETIKQLLQDVEERLVFRTNIFFQHDLTGYKPSPGDLAYPEKLKQMENITLDMRDSRPSSVASIESHEVANINAGHFRSYTGNSPADLHGMWYPTVKRTLVCLSRLYFCLDRDTFQGLAQEALVICISTVGHAAGLISDKKSPVDGQLFQIKHLLIIREQIAPFQVDFTAKEVALDFSTVPRAARHFYEQRSNIFTFGSNNALLEFLLEGTPRVKEYLVDSRKEIDKQLKHSCESFISQVTKFLIASLQTLIEKSEHILKIKHQTNNPELTVRSQDFAQPNKIADVILESQKNMKNRIPDIQRSMQLYLANRETEFILFRPIKNNIVNAFIQIEQILSRGDFTAEDQLQIGCPSPEQINILICSVSLATEQENLLTEAAQNIPS
ncbi:unnamed protein product [Brassicogethes aeneus]|uniref:Conserved oligomeric Golgi complex subunit 3 n=1 Tax=Brassicogethes aeneus TaxID=1431903 RepID=A0A9P0FL96_BRAAE|nr:unnamed protein product [Brassicogethes aeneus]